MNSLFDKIGAELRRGLVQIVALSLLRERLYGYQIVKILAAAGLETEEGTLYPLLRRLENQGLLDSEWREEERRNKRFYRLSAAGEAILERLMAEWKGINASLSRIAAPQYARAARRAK